MISNSQKVSKWAKGMSILSVRIQNFFNLSIYIKGVSISSTNSGHLSSGGIWGYLSSGGIWGSVKFSVDIALSSFCLWGLALFGMI